jgi:hypothetical protein
VSDWDDIDLLASSLDNEIEDDNDDVAESGNDAFVVVVVAVAVSGCATHASTSPLPIDERLVLLLAPVLLFEVSASGPDHEDRFDEEEDNI